MVALKAVRPQILKSIQLVSETNLILSWNRYPDGTESLWWSIWIVVQRKEIKQNTLFVWMYCASNKLSLLTITNITQYFHSSLGALPLHLQTQQLQL